MNNKLVSINDNQLARFTMDIQLSDNIIKTKDGYLHCKNVVMGRTGYQQYYGSELMGLGFNASEIVDVFRDEKEVFHEVTLDSAIGKPVTKGHPDVDVNVGNIKELGKGHIIGRPIRVGDDMVGEVMITDIDLIELVERKQLRELSLGYQTKLVRDGNRVLQKEIYINHLAVVEAGRAGNAMIVDEKTIDSKEVNVLDKLKEQGITININLSDLLNKVEDTKLDDVKVDDENEKKDIVDNSNENNDVDYEDKDKVDDEDKEDDEDKDENKKENEKGDIKDMDIKELMKQMATLSDEDKKEFAKLMGMNDVEPTNDKTQITDNAFGDNSKVENTVIQAVKDFSHIKGDEKEKALQRLHDSKFSFRAMVKASGRDSVKLREHLYDAKDITERDMIGGNK